MLAVRVERVHIIRPRLLLLWSFMLLLLLREVVVVSKMTSCLCGGDEDRADMFCQDRRIVCTWGGAGRGGVLEVYRPGVHWNAYFFVGCRLPAASFSGGILISRG